MLLNNKSGQEWDQERNKKISRNKWKWTHNSPKLRGHSKVSPVREVHRDIGLPKKDRNISNKWPNITPTRTRGITKNKPRVSRWKEIIKIR